MDEVVDAFLVEAVNEATFASSKKWALVVLALLVGGAVALWITGRRHRNDELVGDAPV